MVNLTHFPYPLGSLEDPGKISLFKHLFCLDTEILLKSELETIAEQYLPRRSPGIKSVLDMMAAREAGDSCSFKEKEKVKRQAYAKLHGKIAIINGREDEGHAFKRYKEELARKGLSCDVFWMDHLSIGNNGLEGISPGGAYNLVILASPEPLEADSAPSFLLKNSIIEELERQYRVFPTRLADTTARSKLATLRALTRQGIATPDTLVTASISDGARFVKKMQASGKDTVIKPMAKGGGWGVGKIPKDTTEARMIDILGKYKWWYGNGVFLLQEFIENDGHDKRVLVLDDIIIGTERRSATLDTESWIYNISKGAMGSKDSLDRSERELVLAAARATGQLFCGVDLIKSTGGKHYILEVNSTPGFKGFEQYLGTNVASFVLDYLLLFPLP